MFNPIGIVILVIGVVLLIFGISASDSIASSFSRLFAGRPTDKAIWFLVFGILSTIAGLQLSFRRA